MLRHIILCVLVVAAQAAEKSEKSGVIAKPETWSGAITITGEVEVRAELTVEAGTVITFPGKVAIIAKGGGHVRCQGSAEKPIRMTGPGAVNANGGRLSLAFCRLSQVNVGSWYLQGEGPNLRLEDCVIVDAQLACYNNPVEVRRTFVDAGRNKYAVVEIPPGSQVTDCVFSGGAWVSKALGGTVSGCVFISQPVPDGGKQNDYTHEHICGLHPKARIERNILVGRSYAGVMSIGRHNGEGALIRNNTIDMRDGKGSGHMFHLTEPKAKGLVLRNNLFMRCIGILDEEKTPDAIASTDYNLFAAVAQRHKGVVMSTTKPGEAGCEKHSLDAAEIGSACVDPEFGYPFPYSMEQMLDGSITVAAVLQRYRSAYAPKPGSPLIDAGSPEDAKDAADGHCDIGAVELVR